MYEKQTLPNGVRIVYEHMPHVRSAAIGVWVGVGSRYESPCEAGSAHFIEHMLFKGTAQHSASELAERMDAIGGQVNAYTTREGTCYYARVLDEHLDRAGDLLAEMLFTSNFSETDADNERGVIREEMDMYADTPEDLVTERLIGAAFPGALGRPVLGRPATIDRLTGARLRSFQIAHYIAPRIVIAVSGSFTDENIARTAGSHDAPRQLHPGLHAQAQGHRAKPDQHRLSRPADGGGGALHHGAALVHPRREHVLAPVSDRAREKRSVLRHLHLHGELSRLRHVRHLRRRRPRDGAARARAHPRRARALPHRRRHAVGARPRARTGARERAHGYSELYLGRVLPADEVLARYDAVTCEDILGLARETLDFDRVSFSAVGRLRPQEEYAQQLKG